MTDTPWKARDPMPPRIAGKNAVATQLVWPAPLFAGPWKEGLQEGDKVPCARRVLMLRHPGGGDGFMVHGDPPAHPQNYPEAGVWRTVRQVTCSLAPGAGLEMRVVAVRSGMTEWEDPNPLWQPYGAGGRIRVTVDYDNGTSTDTATAEVDLAPSPNDDGAEPTAAGGSWGYLLFKHVPLVAPAGVKAGTPSELAKWSEGTVITITVDDQGGTRVIQCSVQEVPYKHVVAHDEESEVSIHGWPHELQPLARPQTEATDGATWEEHRQGTARGLAVAERQGQQLGPIVASWGSFSETLAEVSDTDPDPIQVTSTSYVGLSIGSSITTWSADGPGYAVPGYYALRNPENLPSVLNGAGTIPLRLRVHARFTGPGSNTGYLKFQVTARSWVILEVDQAAVGSTWTDLKLTGFIESMVAPNDFTVNLQDFVKVSGGTLELRYWSLEWGDKAVPA